MTFSYDDLELRSQAIKPARYVFNSACPRNATVGEMHRQGVDCAQAIAWIYGPWLEVPDYTGAIYTWAERTKRLIPLADRNAGDLVLRSPGFAGIEIGHVGMVLEDVGVIRQARSAHLTPNCGDWPYSAGTWQTAVRISEVVRGSVTPLVDLAGVAAAMAAAKAQVVAQPLQLFTTGLAVKIVQDKLHIPQTGTYDYGTVAAVDAFQHWWNTHRRQDQPWLDENGVVEVHTWGALFGAYA